VIVDGDQVIEVEGLSSCAGKVRVEQTVTAHNILAESRRDRHRDKLGVFEGVEELAWKRLAAEEDLGGGSVINRKLSSSGLG